MQSSTPHSHSAVSRLPLNNNKSSTSDNKKLFQFVKKTGANLRSRLVKVKHLAVGQRYGKTRPCNARNCLCCEMITDREKFIYNNKTFRTATGSCSSYNIIYLVICKLCSKHYVGRSTRPLKTRIGEHRRHFYQVLDGNPFDPDSDEYALGLHLHNDHGLKNRNDFINNYRVCVLEICSPKLLETKEHKYIHLLNSLAPNGVNISNPFAIPLLYKN